MCCQLLALWNGWHNLECSQCMNKNMCIWCYLTSGSPDVEQPCEPSFQAWSPELSLYDTNLTSPCPDTEGCTLTLRFLHPVVPHALTLWVTYISTSKYHPVTTSYHPFGMCNMFFRLPTINTAGSRKSSDRKHQLLGLQLLTEIWIWW